MKRQTLLTGGAVVFALAVGLGWWVGGVAHRSSATRPRAPAAGLSPDTALGLALRADDSLPFPAGVVPGGWSGSGQRDVTFHTLDGRTASLGGLDGEVVVMNFWATWCPPCLREIPHLVRLQRELAGRGATVVAVAAESGSRETIGKFAAEHGMTYPIWIPESDADIDKFDVFGFPFTLLIDRQGRVRWRYVGPQTYEGLSVEVEKLLGEPTG